jgi:radical SAM superfamily enzyme YgiQ (UPF0313 family)
VKTWICTTLTSFYGPVLGAARLHAYIKKQGHDVHFLDLNQNAYFSLLSRDYLGPALEKIQWSIDSISRNRLLREDIGSILIHSSGQAMKQLAVRGMVLNTGWYKALQKTGVAGRPLFNLISSKVKADNIIYALLSEKEYILSEIEKSRQVLDREFFKLEADEFLQHFYTLLCGKALIDAAYFPSQLDFGLGFYGTAYSPRTGDILKAVEDERYNYLIPYYRKEVLPLLKAENPGVVGISITCMFELAPAFTLAKLIKRYNPQTHIVLGGVLVTELAERIARNMPLWDLFDSLIPGPGEFAFSQLIEHVENRRSLAGAPNLIYRENQSIKRSEKSHEFDLNEACSPEFVSVRPSSGLPLETSSMCYWGRCIFCYYPKQGTTGTEWQPKKRMRNIELVLQDIRDLREKYNPLVICLTDSSVHPKRLEQIAEENIKSRKQVKYSALFRMEKEFKSIAFCRKLVEGGFLGGYVGLESGSQRVNDIIDKGVDLADAGTIIKNFYKTGILLHVYSIVGTPGETEDDARMTYEFFRRWRRWLPLNWQIYPLYVLEQSPLNMRSAEFGLKVTALPDEYLVESMGYSVEKGITQEASMGLAISYSEKLKGFMHPLSRIMDIESMKLFLIAQMAKGRPPAKVKDPGLKI